MAELKVTFDGLASGLPITAANTGFSSITGSGTLVVTGSNVPHGSGAALYTPVSGAARAAVWTLAGGTSAVTIRFVRRRSSNVSEAFDIARAYAGTTSVVAIRPLTDGKLSLLVNGTTVWTSSATVPTGVDVTYSLRATTSTTSGTGILKFDAYLGDSTTVIAGLSYSTTTAPHGTALFTSFQLIRPVGSTDTAQEVWDSIRLRTSTQAGAQDAAVWVTDWTRRLSLAGSLVTGMAIGSTLLSGVSLAAAMLLQNPSPSSTTPSAPVFTLGTTKPSASNTGVGIVRAAPTTAHTSSNFVCTANNQVVKDLVIDGYIDTDGFDDILIENVIVKGNTVTSGGNYLVRTGASNRVTIQYSEIYSEPGYGGAMGIGTGNFTSYRNHIHHVSDAHRVNLSGSATPDAPWFAIIEGNYVHDTIMDTPDPATARTDLKTHSDALVQGESGSNVRVTGNTATGLHSTDGTSSVTHTEAAYPFKAVAAGTAGAIEYAVTTSSIMLSPSTGVVMSNWQITNNWLGGGEVTVNGVEKLTSSTISGNIFDRNSLQNTAIWDKNSATGVTFSGNKYTDGTAI